MKVPKRRHKLLSLAAKAIVAMLFSLGSYDSQGGRSLAAQPTGSPQAAVPAPSVEALHLLVGRSLVITSQARIVRISVADPTIVDALVVSPTQILISGKASGCGIHRHLGMKPDKIKLLMHTSTSTSRN